MSAIGAPGCVAIVAWLLSWLAVRWMLQLAQRRGLVDLPGQRRSHRLPTPRGGGIGMMLVIALMLPWLAWPSGLAGWLWLSLLMVAGIGAWDDFAPRGVLLRLGVQLLAVLCVSMSLLSQAGDSGLWLVLLVPLGVWSINLHNFMDGIDGLLASHGLWLGAALSYLAYALSAPALGGLGLLLAMSCLAFLAFNWAPARIFMGDAGSGGIGLLVFILGLGVVLLRPSLLWSVLALASSFVVDASLTLLWRIYRGRRWSQPHREHLYQWQVRLGRSHAEVAAGYGIWDGLLTGWVIWRGVAGLQLAECLLLYLLASLFWLGYKTLSIRSRRQRELG